MSTNHRNWLIGGVAVVAVVLIYILITQTGAPAPEEITIDDNGTTTQNAGDVATTTLSLDTVTDSGVSITAPPGTTITKIETPSVAAKEPNINIAVSYSANLSIADRAAIQKEIDKVRDLIRQDDEDFRYWNSLGVYYKIAGDFNAARDIWEYLNKAWPTNAISFYNLGELYAYNLKNFVKAETNYLASLENDPTGITTYRALYTFYRYVTGSDEKAKAILQEGITKNPTTSVDLKYLLDHYDEV